MKFKNIYIFTALYIIFFYPFNATAQSSKVVVIRGAQIIDSISSVPIENTVLVIKDDRISGLYSENDKYIRSLEDAEYINATGKTIMPTLVDAHAHLGVVKNLIPSSKNITQENVMAQLHQYARYGIGVIASLGIDEDFIYNMRTQETKSMLHVPKIITAGKGFGVLNAAPPAAFGTDKIYRPENIQDAIKQMNELAKNKPNLVKIWVDDFRGQHAPKMKADIYKTIIREAHKQNIPVVAHVFYMEDAKELIRNGVDILGHSIRDQVVDAELIELMKSHHVSLIPTLSRDEASFIYHDSPEWLKEDFFLNSITHDVLKFLKSNQAPNNIQARSDLIIAKLNLKTLFDAGVKIAFGTDSGASPERAQGFSEHRELELLVDSGLTEFEAVQVATVMSAQSLGIEKDIGTLETGKLANFIILNKNPLKNIKNTQKIHSVWLKGKKVY